jgi:hypothetical protein
MADVTKSLLAYELNPIDCGWELKLYEDGVEVGGGFGRKDDFDMLLEAAEDWCASR